MIWLTYGIISTYIVCFLLFCEFWLIFWPSWMYEFFISVGLELACTQVPKSMQGLSNGIFFFISGMGSFLASAFLKIFQDIILDLNLNCTVTDSDPLDCNMYIYLAIICFISLITLVTFVPVSRRLIPDDINDGQIGITGTIRASIETNLTPNIASG